MSIQAMAWAIEQQEIKEPEGRLVLFCLANYANAVGRNAFPSNARLCRDSGLSERTVRRWLRKLEIASLIAKGNQAVAAAEITRKDCRPVVYDLFVPGVTMTPRSTHEGPLMPVRGVTNAFTGGQAMTPDPKKSVREPKKEDGFTMSAEDGLAKLRSIKAKLKLKSADMPPEEEIEF